MFNKIILIGNLTKDPDLRYTPAGTAVSTVRLAVTSKHKQGEGTKEETLFIDTIVFGKTADNVAQYLRKGSRALIEGRLCERKWEKDGRSYSRMEVVAQGVKFLNAKKEDNAVPRGTMGSDAIPEEHTDMEPF